MLRSIKLPNSTRGENPIFIPVPGDNEPGTITVLCGPNGSGKSHVLNVLKQLIDGRNGGNLQEASGWAVELEGEGKLAAFRPQHQTAQMTTVGTLSIQRARRTAKPDEAFLVLQHRLFFDVLSSVDDLPCGERLAGVTAKEWCDDELLREEILDSIPTDETKGYWTGHCPAELLAVFERWTDSRLGVRRENTTFELVASYRDGTSATYPSWSDGQKSLFSLLTSVLVAQPTVLIFDELENFLHPQLMSEALSYLKQNVRQTIIASHHPHLIFGNAVDEVYFMEKDRRGPARHPLVLKKATQQAAPDRTIVRLATNQEKLAKAYRLFDVRDAALMATASYVESSIEYYLHDAIFELFECAAAPPSKSTYSDRQSAAIAEFVDQFDPFPASVLDWGAGLGRVLRETSKLGSSADAIRIVSDRGDLKNINVGVALLTNVLHALKPEDWVEAISDCWRCVAGREQGLILITEIYPLLRPERRALPLPREQLERFFRSLGCQANGRAFETHGALSYCLAVSDLPPKPPIEDDLLESIEAFWREMGIFHLEVYESIPNARDLKSRNELLNAAFGLATVNSWIDKA